MVSASISARTAIAVNARHAGDSHILRRNTIRYCGIEGIGGMGTTNTLIEDNLIEWCGWADAERGWEAAAAKFHFAHNMLFRRNVIRHIRHANAVWLDSGMPTAASPATSLLTSSPLSAAVHMEMNPEPNQIDNNIIWNVRNAEAGTPGQRGCAGSGIFDNASDRLIIAQNLIGRCDNSGIWAITRPDRARSGKGSDNNIDNNIFASCDKSAIVFINQHNQADGNLYVSMPDNFLGFFTATQNIGSTLPDLASDLWLGQERSLGNMQIDFDPDRLELTISSSQPFPKVNAFDQIDHDLFGTVTGETRAPAPSQIPAPNASGQLILVPRTRCLVPAIDGAFLSAAWNEAPWGKFYTGAPPRQRRSVERYIVVKRA